MFQDAKFVVFVRAATEITIHQYRKPVYNKAVICTSDTGVV